MPYSAATASELVNYNAGLCCQSHSRQHGYTLVELIVVMVLLGIVGTFVFSYIGFGAQIYRDTTGREQLVSQSRFGIERLTQELRNALPRSIRVSSDNQACVEFLPIITSSNYLQMPRPGPTSSDDFIGLLPIRSDQVINKYLFVYATNQNFIYGNTNLRRKVINDLDVGSPEAGLATFGYATTPSFFATDSPARRFYVADTPVSWCYNQTLGHIERYTHYGLLETQPTHAELASLFALNMEVMATDVVNDLNTASELPFRVFEATLQRSSLVQIDWRFRRGGSNEPLQILHEVHVPNVP